MDCKQSNGAQYGAFVYDSGDRHANLDGTMPYRSGERGYVVRGCNDSNYWRNFNMHEYWNILLYIQFICGRRFGYQYVQEWQYSSCGK